MPREACGTEMEHTSDPSADIGVTRVAEPAR